MGDRADMAERHGRMLARFGELALELAEQVQSDAMAAETPAERASMARSFHTVGRTLRQTIALEARLAREAAAEARQAVERAREDAAGRRRERKAQVAAVITPLIWTERETPDAVELEGRLDDLVEEAAALDAFMDGPVEAQIALIAHRLGLTLPPSASQARSEASEPSSSPEGHTSGEVSAKLTEGALPPRQPYERDYWNSA